MKSKTEIIQRKIEVSRAYQDSIRQADDMRRTGMAGAESAALNRAEVWQACENILTWVLGGVQ